MVLSISQIYTSFRLSTLIIVGRIIIIIQVGVMAKLLSAKDYTPTELKQEIINT